MLLADKPHQLKSGLISADKMVACHLQQHGEPVTGALCSALWIKNNNKWETVSHQGTFVTHRE